MAAQHSPAYWKKAPKAELHVHLDGAFDTATLLRAARKYLEELPDTIVTPWDGKSLVVKSKVADCADEKAFECVVTMGPEPKGLFPMLDCFYTFLPIVRGRMDVLEELAFEFVRRQAEHNVIYTELLCCINFRPEWSAEVVELAKQFHGAGVVGVDVASGEQHLEDAPDGALHVGHLNAMKTAQENGIPITVHAGEVGSPQNVRIAIESYGARRIGHGYHCLGTAHYDLACERGVHFEMCPTSSIATKGVDQYKDHPLKTLCGNRCSCSVSTDDPSVFRTDLSEELEKCVESIGISSADVEWMTLEALKAAFGLSPDERVPLEALVRGYYGS